jgi:hypothetical protein
LDEEDKPVNACWPVTIGTQANTADEEWLKKTA